MNSGEKRGSEIKKPNNNKFRRSIKYSIIAIMKLQKKKKGPFNSKTLEQKKSQFEHYNYSLISKIASEVVVTVTRVKLVYKL